MSSTVAFPAEAVTFVEDPDLERLDIAREARGEFVRYSLEVTKVTRVRKSECPAARGERLSPAESAAYKEASARALAEYRANA